MSNKMDYSQWLKRGNNLFIPTDNAKTVDILEPGIYNIKFSEGIGIYAFKKDLLLDDLIDLDKEDHEEGEVLKSIEYFWTRKEKFKEYGFAFKRGILMYGPPGSGKTSIINLLAKSLMDNHDGVIFILQSEEDLNLYRTFMPQMYRIIEPTRPIITVIEDIDGLCERHSTETTLINILDGIEQIDNVVYVATTNYMEKLSPRIMNRPNRFDRRIKIGFPNKAKRKRYIEFKLHPEDLEQIDINNWVNKTANMTIAHIGELIKSVIILGNDFEDTIKILHEMNDKVESYDYNKGDEIDDYNCATQSVGFIQHRNYKDIQEDIEEFIIKGKKSIE